MLCQPIDYRELSQPDGVATMPQPPKKQFQNDIKFLNNFVRKLLKILQH